MTNKDTYLNFKDDSRVQIRNKKFSEKINLDNSLKAGSLSGIIFLDCKFENEFFRGDIMVNCYFLNCRFNKVIFSKFEINECVFDSCELLDSNLTRTDFYKSSF